MKSGRVARVGWHGLRLCEGRGLLDARHALPQSRQVVPPKRQGRATPKSLPFRLRGLYGRATRPDPLILVDSSLLRSNPLEFLACDFWIE